MHVHFCCQLMWACLCRRSAPQSAALAMKDATLVQHMTQLLEALLTNLEAKVSCATVMLV